MKPKTFLLRVLFMLLASVLVCSCTKEEDLKKRLLSFEIDGVFFEVHDALIQNATPYPYHKALDALIPVIETNEGVSVYPDPSIPQNFNKPVEYRLVAKDQTEKRYTVIVKKETESPENRLISFSVDDKACQIKNQEILCLVKKGEDLTSKYPKLKISPRATVSPNRYEEVDLTRAVDYEITSESGLKNTYTVRVEEMAEANIISFSVGNKKYKIVDNYIVHDYRYGVDISSVLPRIVVSEGAKISPKSSVRQDFRKPVKYTITAKDGTKKVYTVAVDVLKNNQAEIISFEVLGKKFVPQYEIISHSFEYGVDLKALRPKITVSPHASISPNPDQITDFSTPILYTVVAQNGNTKQFLVKFTNQLNKEAKILSFAFEDIKVYPRGGGMDIRVDYPRLQNSKPTVPKIQISEGASISPDPTVPQDFNRPVFYRVESQNGDVKMYRIIVHFEYPLDPTEYNKGRFSLKKKFKLPMMVGKKVRIDKKYHTIVDYATLKNALNTGDIKNPSQFITSLITDMSELFYGFNSESNIPIVLDLRTWDVSSVEKMNAMFESSNLIIGGLPHWKVNKLKEVDNMFYNTDFRFDLSNWCLNIQQEPKSFSNNRDWYSKYRPKWNCNTR